jgi:rSAM-associated Gly-rich repeat protein
MMTSRTGAGLLGFLLALASYSSTRVEAAPGESVPADALDARLTRLTEAFHATESTLHIVPTNDPIYIGYVFLNSAPSFRNHAGGWLNRVSGWHNAGTFYNSGRSFLNNLPAFRNAFVGWPNRGISGWLNGGGFRNGGGFNNRGGGGFRNGGGFYNR